jgi:hypothetical protein
VDFAKIKAAGADIRFVDSDDSTALDYEIEDWDDGGSTAAIWVEVPSLAANNTDFIYLYYNNAAAGDAQNVTAVWDSNYKGVWHLTEDQAGVSNPNVYKDSTSNAAHAMDTVAATGKDGLIGDGQEFGAGNDLIIGESNLAGISTITISAWVKHDTLPHSIERYVTALPDVAVLRHNYSDNLQYYIKTDGTIRSLQVNGALTTGSWYYVVGTWDGTTQRLYKNGTQIASQTPGGSLDSPDHIRISAWTEEMDGFIDEVRVSDDARSADWIKTSYLSQQENATFNVFGT